MRYALVILLASLATAQDEPAPTPRPQIDWVGEWQDAFKQAETKNRVVMVCINSIDSEAANNRTAKIIYRDAEFVALSREFVMVIVSTQAHSASGACIRFGKVTCEQHGACYKELRAAYADHFMMPGNRGETISPQHAWFHPGKTLLRRKEYELTKGELLKRMRDVLARFADGKGDPAPEPPPETPDPEQAEDAPLDDKDRSELQRAQSGDKEARRAALANVLATGKTAAHAAVVDLLLASRNPALRCDILHALGSARVVSAREAIEGCLEDKKDPLVRSCAAVALEELAHAASIEPLIKRSKRERDTFARKNMYRALGACGGGAADAKAAKTLFKAVSTDKQIAVRKHAAVALKSYGSEAGKKVVLKKMESMATREKNRQVRGALVYSLAFIGERKTTLPVFQKILEKVNDDYAKRWMRDAIKVLTKRASGFGGRSAWWLFSEDRDDPARQDD